MYEVKSRYLCHDFTLSIPASRKIKGFILLACIMAAAEVKSQVVYDVEPAVESLEKTRTERTKSSDKKISGYRIFVGFSSKRTEANEIQRKADEIFGSTYGALLIFDEPNFKVYIGAFTTAAEADAALADIKRNFLQPENCDFKSQIQAI